MRFRLMGLALLVVALAGTQALASYEVKFGDRCVNWPGYSGYGLDENGVPIFPGSPSTPLSENNKAGVVSLDQAHNRLLSVTINYVGGNQYTSLWRHLRPGDLMLDTDDVPGWDYIIRSPVAPVGNYTATNGILAAGLWNVYHFDTDISLSNTGQYMLAADSKTRSNGSWPGTVRGYHPWAIKDSWLTTQLTTDTNPSLAGLQANAQLVGTVYCDGWKDPPAGATSAWIGSIGFDFSSLNICLDQLKLSFTVSCANDVLYDCVELREPTGDVPEPASLLVWAVLGLSFAGGSWRMAFRRRRWTHWDAEE